MQEKYTTSYASFLGRIYYIIHKPKNIFFRESKASFKEFWYLVFSFKEDDEKQYIVCDTQVFQDMVATIVYDRKISKEADNKVDLANKQRRMAETMNTELEAKVDRLQAEIDYLKALLKSKEGDEL